MGERERATGGSVKMMLTPRKQRLKLFFAFILGAALTATLFSATWLDVWWCTAGDKPCSRSSRHRLRGVLGILGATSASRTLPMPYYSQEAEPTVNQPSSTPSGITTTTTLLGAPFSKPIVNQPSRAKQREGGFSEGRPMPPFPTESSTYSIPKLKYGQRTFPVPSEAPYHNTLMAERLSKPCPATDVFCRMRLSPTEDQQFSKCTNKCERQTQKFGTVKDGSCLFLDGRGRLPVALGSFPGSGNTWMRGLLEKVTGVCTGSLYCDCSLRAGGFTGEGIQGPSVVAMKTHNLKVQFVGGHVFSNTRVPYGAAILLVRDPRGALVAEWNRERSKRMISPNVSNHFTYVGEEYFGDNEMWENYIHLKLPRWPRQMVNLLLEAKSAGRPVYVLIFEDLKKNTVGEMKKVSDFLGFSLTEEEVAERLRVGFSQFYRNHTSTFTHFTPHQERYVSHVVGTTSQFMKDNDIYDTFPRIDEYL